MDNNDIARILSRWNIAFSHLLPHAECYGSPERSQFRCVVKDQTSHLYLLERIHCESVARKNQIAKQLDHLKKINPLLPIYPYCQVSPSSFWVQELDQQFWMLSPYIPATPLQRPSYLDDEWRGMIFAQFLLELRKSADSCSDLDQSKFSPNLENYILSLVRAIEQNESSLYDEIKPLIHHLKQNFFPLLPLLPHSFSHGDYHPLNLLWKDKTLCAVIDWEFSGFHPELYDLANLVTCLGMEHPSALENDICILLIKTVKNAHIHSRYSWESFLDLMLAIRFAWLSEWLRKKDTEMIALEIVYMQLLLENNKNLSQIWELFSS